MQILKVANIQYDLPTMYYFLDVDSHNIEKVSFIDHHEDIPHQILTISM